MTHLDIERMKFRHKQVHFTWDQKLEMWQSILRSNRRGLATQQGKYNAQAARGFVDSEHELRMCQNVDRQTGNIWQAQSAIDELELLLAREAMINV